MLLGRIQRICKSYQFKMLSTIVYEETRHDIVISETCRNFIAYWDKIIECLWL